MESQNSVRSRLRGAAVEADDRALYDDLRAERAAPVTTPSVPVVPLATTLSRRPGLDAFLSTLVRSAYRVDDATRYARARPLTTIAIAAGVGALLARLLMRGRRAD